MFTGLGLVSTAPHLWASLAQELSEIPPVLHPSTLQWMCRDGALPSTFISVAFPQLYIVGEAWGLQPSNLPDCRASSVWCWACFKWHWGRDRGWCQRCGIHSQKKKSSPISLSYAFLLIQAGKRWKSNILCPKHAQCPTHGCCSCISVRGNCKRFAQHQLQLQRQTWGSMCLLCVLLSFIYSTHQWNSVNVLGLRKLLLTVYKPTDLRAVVVFHCCVLWSKCLCKGVMALLFHLYGNCTSSFLIFCLEYFTSENTNAASSL